MATNRVNQVGPGGFHDGRSVRGFAAMDDEKQRAIARKGGEASARSQVRDEQGQFSGRLASGGSPGQRGAGGSPGQRGAGGSPGQRASGGPGRSPNR